MTKAMTHSNHAQNAQNRLQARDGLRCDWPPLTGAEIVITTRVARPASILAEIAADPERSAALALARAYVDEARDLAPGTGLLWLAGESGIAYARHHYRVALGLEQMDVVTGEA